MNTQERTLVLGSVLASLIDLGLTHGQVKEAVCGIAAVADGLSKADIDSLLNGDDDKLAIEKLPRDKLANVGAAAAAFPGMTAVVIDLATRGSNQALNWSGNIAEGVASKVMNTAPWALAAVPVAAAGGAYMAGKTMAERAGDDKSQVDEIHHQELVSALRRNAANLKRHTRS